MITVAKFGGSSVANSTQFKKVKNIVTGNRDIKYVVTSACGKENKEDHKITDLWSEPQKLDNQLEGFFL